MSRCGIACAWLFATALIFVACADPRDNNAGGPTGPCEDADHDGYGRDCERGPDCNDGDAKITYECRSCANHDHGCPCEDEAAVESCFLPPRELANGALQCAEGTRVCRSGTWSGCESVHQYVVDQESSAQNIIDPSAGRETCNRCDVKCFKVVDNLLISGGVADGSVKFGPSGGITLLGGDGGVMDAGVDAGLGTGCSGLQNCCNTLSGPAKTACDATVVVGDNTRCDKERAVYCPTGTITGPVPNCVLGSGADSDCDGIPNAVDSANGKPFPTTANQTIFHMLDIGESATNGIDVNFKLKNADVYFLMDMTGTMMDERDALVTSLTTNNVVDCAFLSQCCGSSSACATIVASNDWSMCAAAQPTYCGKTVDCADANLDGAPDNTLKPQGVVGAVRCLVGTSWFGTGFFRDVPIRDEGSSTVDISDRDELLFRHLVDMTSDIDSVRVALSAMAVNHNYDDPEGGMLALYSLITGKGHYFGVNRPSVPDRSAAQGCGVPGAFGYACFRPDAIPIVVFMTDRPSYNGPPADSTLEPTNCEGRGQGCPYEFLNNTPGWTSTSVESSTDKTAHYVPKTAESFSTALQLGDVRGKYFTVSGSTAGMTANYPGSIVGCSASNDSPDALITFKVGAGSNIPVHFKLTKDDAYDVDSYGQWIPDFHPVGRNDPTPATEFGAVVSLFRGIPSSVSTTQDVMDKVFNIVGSGPDGAYLSYKGTTAGTMSTSGFRGGITGCGADGQSNQTTYTFRPNADAHVVFDATSSSFPVTMSLHEGKSSTLPANPSPVGLTNENDTFALAEAIPSGSTSIDGAYVERVGDTRATLVHADYNTRHTLTMSGLRTTNSMSIKGLTRPELLYVGLPLANSMGWSSNNVKVTSITGNVAKMSATWNGGTDSVATAIAFDDTVVGCEADLSARDTVFKFNVATPRRVRIDTEGTSFDTVISLHDGQPPVPITRNDVSNNGTAPGFDLGDLSSKQYTLSDVGSGTSALANNYDFVQCGSAAAANDAVFRFTLPKATRIGLDVGASSWDPVVGLFSAVPGAATVLPSTNANDVTAMDLGNVLGQVSTKVTGATLTGMADNFLTGIVGCGSASGGLDQVFKFTPSGNTTLRIAATPSVANFYPVVTVFDGPPPQTVPPQTVTAYDVASVTVSETGCQVYSFHDPALPAAHLYTVCANRKYSDTAQTLCAGGTVGMDSLAYVNSAAEQTFLAGLAAAGDPSYTYGYHLGAKIVSDPTFLWRDNTPVSLSNWDTSEPNESSTHKCAAMLASGKWEDKRCATSAFAAADDQAYYLCEETSPGGVAPAEDLATAQLIDPRGRVVTVTGSTLRMHNNYNAAQLMASCGGTVSAGDAVFKIDTSAGNYKLSVDTAGSGYSPVIGLFDTTIDVNGFKACDAAGGAALEYDLQPNHIYYLVVDGTALSPEGSYKLKFADKTAVTDTGAAITCGAGVNAMNPVASVDVEVEANHTYYFVVDRTATSSTVGAYGLQVSALYQAREVVSNTIPTNERGVSAYSLPDPYRSKITVVDTTTSGMNGDYAITTCGGAATASPDAVYKFRPSQNTGLQLTVTPKGAGLTTPGVYLYDGPPVTTPVLHDLVADGNPNETVATAASVSLGSSTQRYDGNTSSMVKDVDSVLDACGSGTSGDAMFTFSLTSPTEVEIDASASAMSDPVLRLFKDGPIARPTATALTNDDRSAADANPGSPVVIGDATPWVQYSGNMAGLTSSAQTQVSVASTNSDGVPQDLGDVSSKRLTIGGGNTTSLAADYPAACGAAVGGKDVLYKVSSATATRLHVVATPASGFDMALALYQGPNGPPLRTVDSSTVTVDNTCALEPAAAPRNITRPTLLAMAPDVAGAVDVDLNCATPGISTTDPDGAGAQVVSFSNWCGPMPTAYVQTQPGAPDAVVLLMHSLRVRAGATLRLTGDRPVIFVVTDDATIEGVISANGTAAAGAGGGVSCAASGGGDSTSLGGTSGGGGGGGFATAGGLGGNGLGPGPTTLPGGAAGVARGSAALVPLIGGCNGGESDASVLGGYAGGAVQISALGDLVVSGGSIDADGGDGLQPAFGTHGGSGGGSGGAVLLEGMTLTIDSGALRVSGGDGASGNGPGAAAPGGPGSTTSSVSGGNGGTGNGTRGGGGGGGGFGRTRTETRTLSLAPCGPAGFEDAGSALSLDADSSGMETVQLGDTTSMRHDHDLTACGAAPDAHDAVYAFTLSRKSDVRINAVNSPNTTVVALYDANGLISGGSPFACANSMTSKVIDATLSAGDYRIVVASTTTSGGTYEVRVNNQNFAATAASQVACDASGSELFYDLQANTPYYLLVKGTTGAESGSFGLLVETAGTGPSMGCGASLGAADAVYKFTLASQRNVSIETEGTTTDTVIAVYPSSATAFDTNYATDVFGVKVDCDDNSGSGPIASRIDATLAPGSYYAVVKRKTLSWSNASQPFRLSIRDNQSTASLACASATIGNKKILQTLQPGTYRVAVSSASGTGGGYSVKFRDVTHFGLETGVQLACASGAGSSLTYPTFQANRDYYVVVKGKLATEAGGYELRVEDTISLSTAAGSTAVACAEEGKSIDGVYPAGTYYAVVSGKSMAEGGPYTLHVQDLDTPNDVNRLACNDDGGPNKTSVIEASLAAGTHYVVVKGKSPSDRGRYELRVRDLDSVSDHRLVCGGGTAGTARFEYDVKAGKDYTLLMKGADSTAKGNYALNMYDSGGSASASGSQIQCMSDSQPSPVRPTSWPFDKKEFTTNLSPDTYYVAVKGLRTSDSGFFQLQIGEKNKETQTTYTAPSWNMTRDALVSAGVHVLPVMATKGDTAAYVSTGNVQASLLAKATGSTRADGTPIWQQINSTGVGTGTGLVSAIAELASHLAMNVSLSAVDGPDPGASRFKVSITPQNSPNCKNPHPLLDSSGACSLSVAGYNCNTQYECRPGASPKFRVTFTNPDTSPVPVNPNNPYGGYLFKLQLKGDNKYLLDEVPVFIIPTTQMLPQPPNTYQTEGTYQQNIDASSCKSERQPDGTYKFNPSSTELPEWRDLYYKASVPQGTSIDFELCAADTEAKLNSCLWSESSGSMRSKVTITGGADCTKDAQCLNVGGKNGFCSDYGYCQFIDRPKVNWDQSCSNDSQCDNGTAGSSDYTVSSHCERTTSAYGYGHCVYHSVPVDIGSTLAPSENGKLFSRIRIKLHSNSNGTATPTLYEWYMTYRCQAML